MADARRRNILISEPSAWETGIVVRLPYIWGILKSYCEQHAEDVADQFHWLRPIFLPGAVSTLLEPHETKTVDVLGLSCYTWNWDLQCQIAATVKARNPQCLVIAGGPDPDYKDPDFFRKHPFIDMVAVHDGEITFTKVLEKVARGERNFTDIRGLYLPGDEGPLSTGPPEIPLVFEESPYIKQSGFYEDVVRKHEHIGAILETNRGCPYGCSFCDWGANNPSMSKVRRFDMERVKTEIDWLGRMGIYALGFADANFGMLPRDLEIADFLTSTHAKYGRPTYLAYNNAKNNPDRTTAIAKKFFASGMQMGYQLAIQHTRKEVLDANNRANISADKQVQVAKELMGAGNAIDVQLILGLPGDTYELWKSCFADLMEWGIHSYYLVYFYHLLPNAPVADPDYMEKWQIETLTRYVFTFSSAKRERGPVDVQTVKNRIIVSTKTFSQDDWIAMATYAAFVKALHNCGLTQVIAKYLRFTHGVSYREFYEELIESCCARVEPMKSWYQAVVDHYRAFLADEEAIDFMDVREWPRYQYQMNPFQWVCVQSCMQLESFFDTLEGFLVEKYPFATNLASVIQYQKDLVILPDYRRESGKSFATGFNWIEYFEAADQLSTYEPLDEPAPAPDSSISVSDQNCTDGILSYPLDWNSGNEEDDWAIWFERTVEHHSCPTKLNFQELDLRSRTKPEVLGGSPIGLSG